jgi:C-terminal processing protease CtpA/Prc
MQLCVIVAGQSGLQASMMRLTCCCATVQVNLKREKLELSPVYSTAVDHDGHRLGYIRLVNFGQHAALDMQHAVQKLQASSGLSHGPIIASSHFLHKGVCAIQDP